MILLTGSQLSYCGADIVQIYGAIILRPQIRTCQHPSSLPNPNCRPLQSSYQVREFKTELQKHLQ
jgi:hypothetical protein